VWAWFQYENERQRRPDLRSGGHLSAGTSGVLIELSVPDREVLLSDFDLWHYALNRWYLPATLRDYARIEKLSYDDLPRGREMEESWSRIFDIEWSLKDVAEPRSQKSIQAAVWEVPLARVRSVRYFRARGRVLPVKSIRLWSQPLVTNDPSPHRHHLHAPPFPLLPEPRAAVRGVVAEDDEAVAIMGEGP
jgi:hypothetical protein